MSNHLIKTSESEVKQDKNGRNYKTIVLTEVVMMNTPWGVMQKPESQSVSRPINRYEKSYLNEKPETGFHDPIFNPKAPQNGGVFEGSIERRRVEPYDIEAKDGAVREANHYTTVVFGNTDSPDFEDLIISTFKNDGHPVLEAAELTVEDQIPADTTEKVKF